MTLGTFSARLTLLCLLAGAGLAHAKASAEVTLDLPPSATPDLFEQQRGKIVAAIGDREGYSELRADDRKVVNAHLESIGTQLSSSGTLAQLPDDQRASVLAQQSEINSILDRARNDSRVVCTREKEMGSNFRRSICLTVGQRRRDADAARGMVREGS